MTKPKTIGECPICGKVLDFVAKHLREIHSLQNVRERSILNFLATGRTLIPGGPCPLPGCSPHLLCVEKHLRTHSELPKVNVDREIKALKRTAAINQLAALRATDPHPPMVSTLDQPEDQAQQSDPEAGVMVRPHQPRYSRWITRVTRLTSRLISVWWFNASNASTRQRS